MKYYKLTQIGVDRNIVGIYPQSVEVESIGDIQNIKYTITEKIKDKFNTPIPILRKRAKLTTFISVTAIPHDFMVVHKSFIQFLINYNYNDFQCWALNVKKEGDIFADYHLFTITSDSDSKLIDFENSLFQIRSLNDFKYIGETIHFSDFHHYNEYCIELKKKRLWLKAVDLKFYTKKFDLSIFKLSLSPFFGYYVSDKLKCEMEKNGFTGIKFKEMK